MEGVPLSLGLVLDLRQVEVLGQLVLLFGLLGLARIGLGIFVHGITETWVMEKALIGLVACEKERHTAENISKWTEEALEAIGLTAEGLLAPDE